MSYAEAKEHLALFDVIKRIMDSNCTKFVIGGPVLATAQISSFARAIATVQAQAPTLKEEFWTDQTKQALLSTFWSTST